MIGFNVTFYLFQYNEVVHPGVVTKVMGNVSQSKVGMFLVCFPIKGGMFLVCFSIKGWYVFGMFSNERLVCFWYVFQSKVGTLFILSRSELKVMKSCVNLLYPPLYKCACYQVLTWCCQIKLTFEITENHCF